MDTELSQAYEYVPVSFHWILQLIEKNQLKMDQKIRNGQQNNLMEYIRLMIKWMNSHHVCQPFWLKMMYHLIKAYKITILRQFRQGFNTILIEKIKKWTSKGVEIVKLLESIGKQLGEEFIYNKMGLMELAEIMRISALYMRQLNKTDYRQLIELSDTQYKVYKFILKAGGWVRDCRRTMMQIKTGKNKRIPMNVYMKRYQQVKQQEEYIERSLLPKMTCLEVSFYKDMRTLFKKFELQFRVMCQLKDQEQIIHYIMTLPSLSFFKYQSQTHTIPQPQPPKRPYSLPTQPSTTSSHHYKRIPKPLRYVCQLLQNSNSPYVRCKNKVDPKQIMRDIEQLCFWLSQNLLAKKLWFRIVQKLIPVFKLAVLSFLKDGFKRIYSSKRKSKAFKKRGEKLMAMIWKIVLQVGNGSWFISFNLNYEWKLCEKLNLDRFIIDRIEQQEPLNVKLTPSQLQVYRLISAATKWAMKLRKTLNFKITLKSYHHSSLDLQYTLSDLLKIQSQRLMVQKKYASSFNIFESKFYHSNLALYFKVKEEFEELVEKRERRKESETKGGSDDNDGESDGEKRERGKNKKRYDREESDRDNSRDREEESQSREEKQSRSRRPYYAESQRSLNSCRRQASQSQLQSNSDNQSQQSSSVHNQANQPQTNPLKRQWIDRHSQHSQNSQPFDNNDQQQGQMSLDDLYILPPTEEDIDERKRQIQLSTVKKEMTVKEEHIQRLRGLVRERLQQRKLVKLESGYGKQGDMGEDKKDIEDSRIGKNRQSDDELDYNHEDSQSQQRRRSKIYDMLIIDD